MVKLFIIDLRAVIVPYSQKANLYDIYRLSSLTSIITALLSNNPHYEDILEDELSKGDIDETHLDVIYEEMYRDLNHHITSQIRDRIECQACQLLEWVDQTSVLLAASDNEDEDFDVIQYGLYR